MYLGETSETGRNRDQRHNKSNAHIYDTNFLSKISRHRNLSNKNCIVT